MRLRGATLMTLGVFICIGSGLASASAQPVVSRLAVPHQLLGAPKVQATSGVDVSAAGRAGGDASWPSLFGSGGETAANPDERRITTSTVRHLHKVWKYHTTDPELMPATAGDGLIFAVGEQFGTHTRYVDKLVALTARTGRVRWSHRFPDGSLNSAVVVDGRVVVLSGVDTANHESYRQTLVAYNERSGRLSWRHPLSINADFSSQVNAAEGKIALYTDHEVALYRASNGHRAWHADATSSYPLSEPPAIAHHRVYLPDSSDVDVRSLGNGHLLWRAETGPGAVSVDSRYLIADNGEGYLTAFRADGCHHHVCSPLWARQLPRPVTHLAVEDGVIVATEIGEGDNHNPNWVYALRERTGRTIWRSTSQAFPTNPAIAGHVAYVPDENAGLVFAYKLDGCGHRTCKPIWTSSGDGGYGMNGVNDVTISDGELIVPFMQYYIAYRPKKSSH